MKILAPVFILLTLLSACQPLYSTGGPIPISGGHEGNETAAMESMEGPGR